MEQTLHAALLVISERQLFSAAERSAMGFALSYLADGHPEEAVALVNPALTTLAQNSFAKAVFKPQIQAFFHDLTKIYMETHGLYLFTKCNNAIYNRPENETDVAVFEFCLMFLCRLKNTHEVLSMNARTELTPQLLTQITGVAPMGAGRFLAEFLERKSISVSQAAETLGCTPNELTLLLQGGDLPDEIAASVHRHYGLSLEMLFNLELAAKMHRTVQLITKSGVPS